MRHHLITIGADFMNNLKTFILMAGLTALFIAIGGILGGQTGIIIAVVFAVAMNMGSYWYSDKIVLRLYQAKEVSANHSSAIYQIVADLAKRAKLPMPKVYIIDNDAPNAFATGRNPNNAAVAATTGLIAMLSQQELTGVLAHEMSHILHRDTLISAVSATIAGAISGIANLFMWLSLFGGGRDGENANPFVAILLMILAPIAAMLIQMTISRSREYAADAAGAKLCGQPLWLASALEKLEASKQHVSFKNAEKYPATAHLFIVNPLHGQKAAELFSTHPLTAERIRRLRAMV